MIKTCFENVKMKTPLVHNITNYVTVNDVANVLLACGGSPIMADDIDDVEDITSICGGLNINIGTLNKNTIPSMLAAGKKANELGHAVLLDPVGAGASRLRTETAIKLLNEIKFDVIRGNISEIKTLAFGSGSTKGVDADVADADTCYVIRNGRPEMGKITGTGCQLSGLMTAYLTANPDNKLEAAATAVILMGVAGEVGFANMESTDGNSTYRNRIIDAIYNMDADKLCSMAKCEIR